MNRNHNHNHNHNYKYAVLLMFLMLFSIACGSINRVTPAGADRTAMEADVRGKIAAAGIPEKAFAVEVSVGDNGVVTLSGHAASEADRARIAEAANSVSGVTRVINNITIKP